MVFKTTRVRGGEKQWQRVTISPDHPLPYPFGVKVEQFQAGDLLSAGGSIVFRAEWCLCCAAFWCMWGAIMVKDRA